MEVRFEKPKTIEKETYMKVSKLSKVRVYYVVSNNKTVWAVQLHHIDLANDTVIFREVGNTREKGGPRFVFNCTVDGDVIRFAGVKTVSLDGRPEGFCDLYFSASTARDAVHSVIKDHLKIKIAELRATAAREVKRVRTEARAAAKAALA